MQELANKYTSLAREACFLALSKTSHPLLEAVKQYNYDSIKIVDKTVGESKIPVRSIEDTKRDIDLKKLHKFVPGGIGCESNWLHMIEKFNLLLTVRVCNEIKADYHEIVKLSDIADCYAMGEIARKIELGTDVSSNDKILESLQIVVTAMLGGDYAAELRDVRYLNCVYSKKGKSALKVSCANHNYLLKYITNICYRIVTNGNYTADYKKVDK